MTVQNCVVDKPGRRRLRAGDPDFQPPDGGWGWMIVVAAGTSNLCVFPVLQQFGLLFRDRFADLGINGSQTTTIINLNAALTACVGLANGPMFRRFTYRQVSFTGAVVCAISLLILAHATTFIEYLVSFSILYGIGMGISTSANALALNTYFRQKRRIATGFSWTATALGPIIMPHFITAIMAIYGVEGTMLIFAGIAGNAIICACLLQPVHWHTKFRDEIQPEEGTKPLLTVMSCDNVNTEYYGNGQLKKSKSVLSTQYLCNDDDYCEPGYEIIDPGTPMMSRANDGWYGSRLSLASNKSGKKYLDPESIGNLSPSSRTSYSNLSETKTKKSVEGRKRKVSRANRSEKIEEEKLVEENGSQDDNQNGTKKEENNKTRDVSDQDILKGVCLKLEKFQTNGIGKVHTCPEFKVIEKQEEEVIVEPKLTFLQKIVIFFDLDLIKDPIYVNIMIGITLGGFAELNFSILTPFVLGDFGFTKSQTATFMSLLAGVDISVRFFIPFLADKIGWSNRTFFLIGISMMAIGRIMLAHTQHYEISLAIGVFIGFGKGLRTIFMALAIPSHVPLPRLPAATGIHLLTSGMFSLTMGPVIGWIRDSTNDFVLMLHCLNIFTFTVVISWTLEKIVLSRLAKKKSITQNEESIKK